MLDTVRRARQVELRVERQRRERCKWLDGGLMTASLALSLVLLVVIIPLAGGRGGSVPGFYGSTLLFDGAGGYVLVCVVSFMVAVVVTLLCIRGKKKKMKSKDTLIGEEQNEHEV